MLKQFLTRGYKITQVVVCLCVLVLVNSCATKEHESFLFTRDGQPHSVLQQALQVTGIEHDGTIRDIIAKTQAAWLRGAGQERWHIEGTPHPEHELLWKLFKQLKMVDEIAPKYKTYDYLLLMGALAPRVKSRLDHAIRLWQQGVRFKTIVMLAGERPLIEDKEDAESLERLLGEPVARNQMPRTEFEMMHLIFDRTDLPAGMEQVPVVWVNAPMKQRADGTLVRPNTDDTVYAWLALQPVPGRSLVISNQPYTHRQALVARTLLPKDFPIDAAGQAVSHDIKDKEMLDSLARFMYQEYQTLQKGSNHEN